MKKYVLIANDIRSKILHGTYKATDKIPYEKELCEQYDVSKMSVKKAMDILVSEGLIVKRRGSGTFVKDLSVSEIERMAINEQFKGTTAYYPGKDVSSKILNFSVIEAPGNALLKLNLDAGSFVYDIYRVRFVDKEPIAMEQMYMPINLIPGLNKTIVSSSIYEYIEEDLGLKIKSAHRKVTVRKPSAIEMKHLLLKNDEPVAVAEQTAYLSDGKAFEFSTSVHRYDHFSIETIINRD